MTKTLMILRHAKSSWKDKNLKDYDRPLKKKGEEAAELLGKIIAHGKFQPDIILSSPAKRTKETAEIVSKFSEYKGPVDFVDAFYMGEPGDYIRSLRHLPDDVNRAMVVGHNPGLEALMQMLEGTVNALSTGAMGILDLELSHWGDLNSSTVGKLVKFWDPEEMDLKAIEEKMAQEKKDKKDKKDKKEKKEKKSKKKDKK